MATKHKAPPSTAKSPEPLQQPQQPLQRIQITPHILRAINFHQQTSYLSPPSSPPAMIQQHNCSHLLLYNPQNPTTADLDYNMTTYLLLNNNNQIQKIPPRKIRQLMEDPQNAQDPWLKLKWLTRNGDLVPTHLPDWSDLVNLTPVMKVYLTWSILKIRREKAPLILPPDMQSLIDLPPRMPNYWVTSILKYDSINLKVESFSNAIRAIRTTRKARQVKIRANWTEVAGRKKTRRFDISINPRNALIYDPQMKMEVEVPDSQNWKPEKGLLRLPPVPPEMSFLYWNARGIARPSFKNNLLHIISVHKPNMVILSEIRTSKSNTETISQTLPFDKFELVEPVGFLGGLLVLWNSNSLEFEVIKKSSQSIHGFCQVLPHRTPFLLTPIYASPKFSLRQLLWE